MNKTYYDCEICGALHRWEFDGDCRQDSERFTLDDLGTSDVVRTMAERIAADLGEE